MKYILHIIPNDEPHQILDGLSLNAAFAVIRGREEHNFNSFSYTIYPDNETNTF